MSRNPSLAARVSSIERSISFYRKTLGRTVVEPQPGVAIVEPNGMPLLLAGPDTGDITQLLATPHEVLRPGATIHQFSPDVDALLTRLSGTDARLDETS